MRTLLLSILALATNSYAVTIGSTGGTTNASELTSGTLPNGRLDSSSVTLKGNWSLEMPGPIQGASVSGSSASFSSTTHSGTASVANNLTVGILVSASSMTASSHTASGTGSFSSSVVVGQAINVGKGVVSESLEATRSGGFSVKATSNITTIDGGFTGNFVDVSTMFAKSTATFEWIARVGNSSRGAALVVKGTGTATSLFELVDSAGSPAYIFYDDYRIVMGENLSRANSFVGMRLAPPSGDVYIGIERPNNTREAGFRFRTGTTDDWILANVSTAGDLDWLSGGNSRVARMMKTTGNLVLGATHTGPPAQLLVEGKTNMEGAVTVRASSVTVLAVSDTLKAAVTSSGTVVVNSTSTVSATVVFEAIRQENNTASFQILEDGHLYSSGTAANLGAGCGTGAILRGNDVAGSVTVGSSPGATCVVNFGETWNVKPSCAANNETTAQLLRATPTTTAVTFTGTIAQNDVINWICMGHR